MSDITVRAGNRRSTPLGPVTQVRIEAEPERVLSWAEVYGAFVEAFPGKWAVMMYPPKDELIDTAHAYHVYVLDDPPPRELNLRLTG